MSPLPSAMVSLAGCSDAAIDSRNPNRHCRCIRLKRQVQRIENRVMEIWQRSEIEITSYPAGEESAKF
ncbi:hypothetical protein KP509_1Z054300 [Ceratopteris richardii]|nr:hypothetical protein KP509_1Z054300 [Ceratopteris richardii]